MTFKHHITLVVAGTPVGEPRTRATAFRSRKTGKMTARMYKPDNGPDERWRECIRTALCLSGKTPTEPLDCPLRINQTFVLPRPEYMKTKSWISKHGNGRYPHTAKPDYDNLVKLVLDVLKKSGVCRDDALVFSGQTEKWYAGVHEEPVAVIDVSTWEEEYKP